MWARARLSENIYLETNEQSRAINRIPLTKKRKLLCRAKYNLCLFSQFFYLVKSIATPLQFYSTMAILCKIKTKVAGYAFDFVVHG